MEEFLKTKSAAPIAIRAQVVGSGTACAFSTKPMPLAAPPMPPLLLIVNAKVFSVPLAYRCRRPGYFR